MTRMITNIKKLEAELWESADLLRQGSKLTSSQYCMPVLALLFLRYAFSRFKMVEAEILQSRPSRGGRVMPVEASDFAAKSALFLPQEAQYDYLVNLPANIADAGLKTKDGKDINSLGEAVNYAMQLVEEQSEQLTGVLPKSYTVFADDLLSDLLRIFNNKTIDEVGGDVIGRIYEYFLSKFAKAVASDDGVFFTPKSLVKMLVNVLEPTSGIMLDPACGSGGMFVQTGDFVNQVGLNANTQMTFYGQEKVEYNAQLCLMNMAVHGLNGKIVSGDEANSFYHDAHNLEGKCDYVMANPPFNVDFSDNRDTLAGENYSDRFWAGVPNVPNKDKDKMAIYQMFLQHIIYSLKKKTGKAAIVVPTGFLTAGTGIPKKIREYIVNERMLRGVISMPSNIFATTGTNVSIIFIDCENRSGKVLLMDASKLGHKEKVDGKNQRTVLEPEEIQDIIDTFSMNEEKDDFSVLVNYEQIEQKKLSFSAGQYFEVKIEYVELTPEEFDAKMTEYTDTLKELFAEGNRLQQEILEQLKKVRYE